MTENIKNKNLLAIVVWKRTGDDVFVVLCDEFGAGVQLQVDVDTRAFPSPANLSKLLNDKFSGSDFSELDLSIETRETNLYTAEDGTEHSVVSVYLKHKPNALGLDNFVTFPQMLRSLKSSPKRTALMRSMQIFFGMLDQPLGVDASEHLLQ